MHVSDAAPRYGTQAHAQEVPPGYKRTDLGVIPVDWSPVFVADVARVKGGKRLPAGSRLVDDPTPYPYVRVSDMYPGGVDVSAIKYVPEAAFPAIRNYRIYADDLFISVAGTLGIVGVVPKEISGANLTENADRLTDLRCERDYLKYWLMSQPIQDSIESIRTVGAQPKLALGRIARFQIALPPPCEQRTIAEALSDVDGLLGALEALIAKRRSIKQAAMQQLLTGKTRLPGFSGEWETKRLGRCGSTYGGITGKGKADFGHGSARYVTFLNVLENPTVQPALFEAVDIGSAETQNRVRRGDVLFNGTSETPEDVALGACVLGDWDDLYLNSFCFGLRFHSGADHDPLFFAYFFRGPTGRQLMSALAQGATRYNMSKRQFLRLECPLPDGDEQRAIAKVLSDLDAEITALEARRDKTRAIKQGMMQQLLTGRVRLVKPEAAA